MNKGWCGIIFTLVEIIVVLVFFYHYSTLKVNKYCKYIYLDLGSNRGIQVRKVYEPHLYPNAFAVKLFDRYFGLKRDQVCSYGFEPNPIHRKELQALEKAYVNHFWRVKFYHVAVSNASGTLAFKRDVSLGTQMAEWGARVISSPDEPLPKHLFVDSDPIIRVEALDFAEWFVKEIDLSLNPVIVAKSDMEFHDNVVWSHMIKKGLICHIQAIYGEHTEGLEDALKYLRDFSNCTTKFIPSDDESYGMSDFPLPNKKT